MRLTALAILSIVTLPAAAAEILGEIRAIRTPSEIKIDGKLNEEAWRAAPPFSNFVENFPDEGAAPSQKTEVRVLYDSRNLYLGVICYDSGPQLIQRQLGRRDSTPTADLVEVMIDPSLTRRTAYYFSVNAGGVLRDALIYGDVNLTDTWDAVWSGVADVRSDGWSAEFAIPLSILRFPDVHEQTWGILVRRTIPRTHQIFDSNLVSRNANAIVSRFGLLTGLIDLEPRPDVELTPYTAARALLRPQYSDPARPHPRLFDPSGDVGLDFKATLFSDLTLTAAINPDFGQVEADQVIQNLGTFEIFFPEKRPFFNQGLDLFQPVGAELGSPQRLFYSRRIGLDAPILGAAKLTGSVGKVWEVGFLDAVVLGPSNPSLAPEVYFDSSRSDYYSLLTPREATPNRSLRFHIDRPFHLGPTDELPGQRPVSRNFFVGVVRRQIGANSTIGAMLTSSAPLSARCYRQDFFSEADYLAADCAPLAGNAAAIDWNLRTRDGEYVFFGQLDASQQVRGPAGGRVLPDGITMYPGDRGWGTYFRVGKLGGEPFRADLYYQYASPKLDLNATGFQSSQNQQAIGGNVHFVKPRGLGKLHNFTIDGGISSWYTTDGKWTHRGDYANLGAYAQLPGYEYIQLILQWEDPRFDVREISKAGIPYERRPDIAVVLLGGTDPNRPLSISGDVFAFRTLPAGPVPVQSGYGTDFTLIWRPIPRLETQLIGALGLKPQGARYVDKLDDGRLIFGAQDPGLLSLTLRQQLVITPTLTLQAYAQLFGQYQHYFSFYQAIPNGTAPIRLNDLQPTTYASNPDLHDSRLNLNIVLRWEYRLGSTFFAVYSRSQQELPTPSNVDPAVSVLPSRLFAGRGIDTFLLKWSYWWSL